MSRPFELVRPMSAGVDLGSREHYVAEPVPAGGEVRKFGCFTRDLVEMGRWLKSSGTTDIAMEATGVYWIPVYEALSTMGFKVALIDGRAAKALPGRKTDVQDCQWIRDLHAHGLVKPCLVPSEDVLALRSYWRQRGRLVSQRAEQIQLMHKALEQMNIQLHKVLSNVAGVTGLAMMRAIVEGERDPQKLLVHVDKAVKAPKEKILLALEGSWADHHVFALGQAVETYDFFGMRLLECDEKIDVAIAKLSGNHPSGPSKRVRHLRNDLSIDMKEGLVNALGVDPTTIDGVSCSTAITLLSELGSDLSIFPTEKHFVSYLRLISRNAITGGRNKKRRKAPPASTRVATALKMGAKSLARTDTAFGAFYRRLRGRIGPSKAITAVARKMATAYYRLLRHGILYQDPGAEAYDEKFKARRIRWVEKQALALGLTLLDPARTVALVGEFP